MRCPICKLEKPEKQRLHSTMGFPLPCRACEEEALEGYNNASQKDREFLHTKRIKAAAKKRKSVQEK